MTPDVPPILQARWLLALALLHVAFPARAPEVRHDLRFPGATAEEVEAAMNRLGPAGLLGDSVPCLGRLLVRGGVSEGRVDIRAIGLGTASGYLEEDRGGTRAQITARVVSAGLHQFAMGTDEELQARIEREIDRGRRAGR